MQLYRQHNRKAKYEWHRIVGMMILCLFGIYIIDAVAAPYDKRKRRRHSDERIYLEQSRELFADEATRPGVQVVKGNVRFRHRGALLFCDSAYFRQEDNTFEAFGHVRMTQGDTLSLKSDYAYYDGRDEMIRARKNVVLRHRKSVLYTDSLDFDRMYNFGYFFEGGRMNDGVNHLVSDWGEYNTQTREAVFYYGVKLKSPDYTIETDTLHYDTRRRTAHVLGQSTIVSEGNTVNTTDGIYNTNSKGMQLFSRSTVVNGNKTITGDSLYYNSKTGEGEGFGRVEYKDKENKNELYADYCRYNDIEGTALATRNALVVDYSQPDTLWMHADTIRLESFNLNTDSLYRKVHGYYHVRAYRNDVQAVCDSLVLCSQDSSAVMHIDPIVWNGNRQLLGEKITVYAADSTIRFARVEGQALSIELMDDSIHYNQVASRDMNAYFNDGILRKTEAIGNVQTVYFPIDDKDSTIIGLNYLETDTMRMFLSEKRQLQKIWTSKYNATTYPMHQVPPGKDRLPAFAWFDNIRPVSKDDIFVWRGKSDGKKLKQQKRREPPRVE
ncbi:MAG: hypothetical protein J6M54_02275 [Prevotella sp.]|nr:hypothetical protein [Prevotella sp.]